MLRRCIASLTLLPAAFIVAGLPSAAPAASIVSEVVTYDNSGNIATDQSVPNGTPGATKFAYYQLTNPRSTAIPESEGVAISVVPPDSVQPPNQTASPLAIVNGAFGFDPKNLQVFLSPASPPPQILGLVFVNGGLASGGTLNFKVSLDPGYTSMTAPPLTTVLPPGADPSTILPTLTSYTPASVNAPPDAPANTPEPASLALWSALAGAGLLRARAFRRSRRAAALA